MEVLSSGIYLIIYLFIYSMLGLTGLDEYT